MNRNTSMPSLLPYLEPGNAKMRIDVTGAPMDATGPPMARFPFRVLSESSPITRLLRAEILTDAGSLVQPVFLLVQKDTYRYHQSELWPLTNPVIEDCWQQAHSLYQSAESRIGPIGAIGQDVIRLGEPAPAGGSRSAFQSLFFCTHRHAFFHPPCPVCGQGLFLCKDDPLLNSQGLSAYASSLRRYIYCPSCPPATAGSGFYAPSPDAADPGSGQSSSDLIAAWRHLLAAGIAPAEFPCRDCPERDNCHGPGNLAAARIIAFAFYPFHMLIVKAMTLCAADFLPLVSGALMGEVESRLPEKSEPERIFTLAAFREMTGNNDLFLFDGTQKHFLEVLYLKLSLLNEISHLFQSGPAPLDINAALDCLWVKIPVRGGFLPGLWNFKAGYMDIGVTRQAAPGRPGADPSQIRYFLGLVWFHALVTNALQPAAAVVAALMEILEKNQGADADIQMTEQFAPENIFWNPAARPLMQFPAAWEDLWKKTLGLAWSLLTAGRRGTAWSSDNFQKDLSAIRKEIKKHLFQEGGAPATAAPDMSDDLAIHGILTGILGKWETADSFTPAKMPGSGDILAETIFLNRGDAPLLRDAGTKPPEIDREMETIVLSKGRERDTFQDMETVVLSGDGVRESRLETVVAAKNNAAEDLEKTVVLSRGTTGAPLAQAPGPVDPDAILSETIILRSPKK